MTLAKRITDLEGRVPRRRDGRPVPDEPVAFARGLLAKQFGPDDLDPTNPNHTGWLTRVVAFMTALTPDHRAGLKALGFAGTESDVPVLDALDAVMRRG